MATLPAPKKPRKKRTHLPSLSPLKLQKALEDIQALALDDKSKAALSDVLKAAANKDHGKADVIVKSLPMERQKLINKTARQMKAITDEVMTRGKGRLLDITADEWDRLVAGD